MTRQLIYYWRGDLRDGTLVKPQDNFGDRLNWTILDSMGAAPAWRAPAQADLVMIGSILEHLPRGWGGTVCGAVKLHENSHVDLGRAKVVALRGKLTAETVAGLRGPVTLGDPALLMPRWIRQYSAKYDVGVLPHWTDRTLRTRFPYGHYIDPTARPEEVVAEIVKCKRLITSSLHGLIIADAYGIPRQAELFPGAASEGGDFKFRDHASLFDGDPHFGHMWLAPHHVVERIQDGLIKALRAVLGLFVPESDVDPGPILWGRRHRSPQLSIIVPFRDDGEHRSRAWRWLRQYWRTQLPSAEIIEGHDEGLPFSKARAVNRAVERSRGRVLALLDADAYLDAARLQGCANAIDAAVAAGHRKWFMPYDKLYRLNRHATTQLLKTPSRQPYQLPSPPPADWLEPGVDCDYGHQYGAMAQVMPREAFFMVGGFDPRFKGWGHEDDALLRALDTLYCQHEVARGDIVHLWHTRPGEGWQSRRWVGQDGPANSRLGQRYVQATGEPSFMRGLVEERVRPSDSSAGSQREKG